MRIRVLRPVHTSLTKTSLTYLDVGEHDLPERSAKALIEQGFAVEMRERDDKSPGPTKKGRPKGARKEVR